MNPAAFFQLVLSGAFSIVSPVPWQYFYVNQGMTWYNAQNYCRTNYIDLVTVRSMQEANNMLTVASAAAPGYSGSVWLGLHRTWSWFTGEPLQIPWISGQPDEGDDGAACGVLNGVGIEDWFCSTTHYFVCYDDSPTATSNFVLVQLGRNWTDAETYCRQHYTHLVIIRSIQQMQQIMSIVSGDAFVGLISAMWSDNNFYPFRYWTTTSFHETRVVNNCVAMVISASGQWNDVACTVVNPFICYGAPALQPVSRLYHAVRHLKNWTDAQVYCRKRFTDLATVDSVNNVSSVMSQVDPIYTGVLWIGLQRATSTRWCWSTGDEPLSDYYNWAVGMPSSSGQCVSNMNGLWSNANCQTLQYFVCYSEGKGYIRVNITKTWQDAQSYCRSTYTDLARIRSPWEQKQLDNVVGRWVTVWIGLFRDNWQWSDQWSRGFRNWLLGPQSVGSGDCGGVMAGNSGRWTNDNCSALHRFVCYGDVDRLYKTMQIVKVRLSSNGLANLDDPSVQAAMLFNIEQKLRASGMNQNFYLSWRVKTDGRVFRKIQLPSGSSGSLEPLRSLGYL